MKVNTVFMDLEQYTALLKDNQRMHSELLSMSKKIKRIEALIWDETNACIKTNRHIEWSHIDVDAIVKALEFDMDALKQTVAEAVARKSSNDVEGYQE